MQKLQQKEKYFSILEINEELKKLLMAKFHHKDSYYIQLLCGLGIENFF